jgi:tetratricopeptide (TPR) repeat protein
MKRPASACAALGFRASRVLLVALVALSLALPARAQVPAVTHEPPAAGASSADGDDEAKSTKQRAAESFNAGVAAYAAGDYLAAIQALEAAYALRPMPQIEFSIAQAERRQYFVDRGAEHLSRSVALFRRYLERAPDGGRRADALEALSQLEPLLAKTQPASAPPPAVAPVRSTRIMVLCDVPAARISVDGGEPGSPPLIREVTAGKHDVQVRAPGYRDGQRQVLAVQGELVPVTVTLQEQSSRLQFSAPEDAEVYVDGVLVSQGASLLQLELPSGRHRVSVAQKGHRVATQSLQLNRGEVATTSFELEPTSQRIASHVLFATGAAMLAAGGAFSYLAVDSENDAQGFVSRQKQANQTTAELVRYDADVTRRNTYRWLAGASFGLSLGLLVTGLFLHELDTPSADDLYRSMPQPRDTRALPDEAASARPPSTPKTRHLELGAFIVPGQLGASLRGEF